MHIGVSFLFISSILIVIWLGYRVLTFKKLKNINKPREVAITLFFIYFLAVVYFTFFKYGFLTISYEHRFYANLIPLKETISMFTNNHIGIKTALYNVVGNTLLFMPLGFFIPLLFDKCNKISKVLLYGFLSSLTIETIQFFTAFNISDIDDVVFNSLGAVLGLLCYRVFYYLLKSIKLSHITESLKDFNKTKLVPIAAKPLAVMLLCSCIAVISTIYSYSYPASTFKSEGSTQAFAVTSSAKPVSKDFNKGKLCLKDYGDYLELSRFKRLPGNRYVLLENSNLSLKGNKCGYTFWPIYDSSNDSVGLVVFGKNTSTKTIVITFNGKKYAEELTADSNFIIAFPSFEKLDADVNLRTALNDKSSKALNIKFLDESGKECTNVPYLTNKRWR